MEQVLPALTILRTISLSQWARVILHHRKIPRKEKSSAMGLRWLRESQAEKGRGIKTTSRNHSNSLSTVTSTSDQKMVLKILILGVAEDSTTCSRAVEAKAGTGATNRNQRLMVGTNNTHSNSSTAITDSWATTMATSNLSTVAGAVGLPVKCEEAGMGDLRWVEVGVAWEALIMCSMETRISRCRSLTSEEVWRVVSEWDPTTRRARVKASSRHSSCRDSCRWAAITKDKATAWEVISG